MASEFPPAPEWVPAINEDTLTRDDARALATAINGVAEAVGRINERLATVEKGAAPTSQLSKLSAVTISCHCGYNLFSASGGDYDRMDWHTIGKGIMEHFAQHLFQYNYQSLTQGFQVHAYPKQEYRR